MSYVYVVTDEPIVEGVNTVFSVKIGFTSDPNIYNKLRCLQTGNPRPLRIWELFEFESSEMGKQMEKLCHWNLAKYRLNGEWFDYSDRTIEVLEALAQVSNHYDSSEIGEYFNSKKIQSAE